MVRELGVAVRVNFAAAGAFTTSVAVALCVSAPLVPVMVSVYVPVGVVVAVVTASVEVPDPFTVVGLNVPVASVGNPLTLSATAPLKPFDADIDGVYVVLPPCVTVCDAGADDSVKSGGTGALTTNVVVVLCVSAPLVPVIVSV